MPKFNQSRWYVLILVLTFGAFAATLMPRQATAQALSQIDNTLQQSTNQLTQPIEGVPQQVSNGVNQVTGSINQTINSTINNTVGAILNPIRNSIGGVVDQVTGGLLGQVDSLIGGLLGQIQGVLKPFTDQIGSFIGSFMTFVNTELGQIFGSIFGQAGGIWDHAGPPIGGGQNSPGHIGSDLFKVGALGIPDFTHTHAGIERMARQAAANGSVTTGLSSIDRFNINPLALAQSFKFESDRVVSRGMAAGLLSQTGQAATQKELQGASQTLQAIGQIATAAQKDDVTQDVMKKLVVMHNGQSALNAGTYAQMIALRQQAAADSVVLANISETADETNRKEHAAQISSTISVINALSNVYLPGMPQANQ